jgi:hypothetical protein
MVAVCCCHALQPRRRSGLLVVDDDEEDGLPELHQRIDQLTGYLDVVESQLMREVATRSRAVAEAATEVGVLHQQVWRAERCVDSLGCHT